VLRRAVINHSVWSFIVQFFYPKLVRIRKEVLMDKWSNDVKLFQSGPQYLFDENEGENQGFQTKNPN
jgi:hypothetical protein